MLVWFLPNSSACHRIWCGIRRKNCNIPGGMLWDGSGCHHFCVWECARWMLPYLFQLLTQVVLGYYLVTAVLSDSILHSLRKSRKSGTKQNVKLCIFIQQQQKYCVLTGVNILIIYVLPKGVHCIIFRNYPCLLNPTRWSWLTGLLIWTREGCCHHYPCPINPLHFQSSSSPKIS